MVVFGWVLLAFIGLLHRYATHYQRPTEKHAIHTGDVLPMEKMTIFLHKMIGPDTRKW
jgi:hypothetical protein